MAMDSLRQMLRRRRHWSAYLLTFDHSEALEAFLVVEDEMDDASYWSILGDAWTATESVAANEETWRRLFTSTRPGREQLMKEADRPLLAELPAEVTAYRGHSHVGGERGLAWTLQRDSAEIFARQFAGSTDLGHPPGEPRLASSNVPRSSIVALFQARREGDILILDLPPEIDVDPL